jgi:serine O-acetyltransferase
MALPLYADVTRVILKAYYLLMKIMTHPVTNDSNNDIVWQGIRHAAEQAISAEPILSSFLHSTVLGHDSFDSSLAFHLASKLETRAASAKSLYKIIIEALTADTTIGQAVRQDLLAVQQRDSACNCLSTPFLYFKGFHALQAYRIAHCLWQQNRKPLALFLQSLTSTQLGVDIHPAAKIGSGILMDHATGIVIGETATVGDNVSLMQSVTLGGTGKEHGDRHPKVGNGVLISAGAKILGNIEIGEGAKVGASSVVLQAVPPHTTVAGVPARIVGHPTSDQPALDMDHGINCDMSND